jgi:DNA topoisomerase-1
VPDQRTKLNGAGPAPRASARATGLTYVTDEATGIRRIKSGKGFRYKNSRGKTVGDRATLARIRALVIPPAWNDVWICPNPRGHLQATGRDARGRKQHRYHPRWREVRDASKYDRLLDFAKVLPSIRRRLGRDLKRNGIDRERILATVVRLMDLTLIRVGNEQYARDNHSYGLSTMKDRHATVRGRTIRFRFRGKSGKSHDIAVEDPRLARIVRQSQDIPGQDLFQYYDDDGRPHAITSGDVNDYLREISGGEFTSRDFRTWAGTVLAMDLLGRTAAAANARTTRKSVASAIEQVAARLGNTVAVCRKCYVHPLVIESFLEGSLPSAPAAATSESPQLKSSRRPRTGLAPDERELLRFLRRTRRTRRRNRAG